MAMWLINSTNVQPQWLALELGTTTNHLTALNIEELKQQLTLDAPPETRQRRAEQLWGWISAVEPEDIIIAGGRIGQCTGALKFLEGQYQLPVTWFEARLPHVTLPATTQPLLEITDPQLRTIIRARLPLKGNPFARWKWLAGLLVGMQAVYMLLQFLK